MPRVLGPGGHLTEKKIGRGQYGCANVWSDGGMDGRRDGRMDGLKYGGTDRQADGQTDGNSPSVEHRPPSSAAQKATELWRLKLTLDRDWKTKQLFLPAVSELR